MPEPTSIDTTPRWVAEAADKAWQELRSFFRTARDFTFHPVRFASDWNGGRSMALNPAGFLATSAAILFSFTQILTRTLGVTIGRSFVLEDLFQSIAPFLYFLLLALFAHVVLRACGSRRPVRGSAAIAFYLGGGPAAFVSAWALCAAAWLHHRLGLTNFVAPAVPRVITSLGVVAVALPQVVVLVLFGAALAGLHGVRGWWAAIAVLLACLGAALVFGYLDPPGSYGLHFALRVHFRPELSVSFNLTL